MLLSCFNPAWDMQHGLAWSKAPGSENTCCCFQAFKTVAKRATDKVLSGLPPAGAPDAPVDTAEAAAAYLSEQRRAKIRVLVNGYVQKYGSL